MISVSDTCRAIIDAGSFTYHVRAESWLGSQQLAEDIPIDDAGEESDRTLSVPERVLLTVPKRDKGVSWVPTSDTDPLSANGQIIKISLGVQVGLSAIEWFQRGEFVLLSTAEDDQGSLRVTCAGKLYLIHEAGFLTPFQPAGNIGATLRALVEPALSVDLSAAPTDRAVPAAVNWDDRLGAVNELLDAWPAVAAVDQLGALVVVPDATPTVAVRSFTDAYGGTVIRAVGTSTRDGGFNVVVATGTANDGGEVRGQALVTTGQWAYLTGQANPLPVPFGYSSPLLTTVEQCTLAARTVLARKQRQAILRRFTITCTPDPTIQLGDPVAITTGTLSGLLCTVEAFTLPYVPGMMTMTVVSTV